MLTAKQQELVGLLLAALPTTPTEAAQQNVDWYKEWLYGEKVGTGDRRWELVNGEKLLFECISPAGLDEGTNLYKPSETPALWKRVWTEEWPEWVQPQGSHDAYEYGSKVTHNGKKWISTFEGANVWEPGVYGWEEYVE